MKIGVYFCECGSIIAGKLDYSGIQRTIAGTADVAYVKIFDLMCASDRLSALAEDLCSEKPDRVVIAACSPRDREDLFQRALEESGINPYLMQMVNIREQVAWVTKDPRQATIKAIALIKAAIARVRLHEPLEKRSIAVCPDVMVIGAGPAGLSSALTLAEVGRRVVLVEKSPAAGGMPTMFDELFPDRECGPCQMGPLLDTMLQGECAGNIELLTLTQVASLKGYFGNFTVTLEQQPRFVDSSLCIGCGECVAVCPASSPSAFNCGFGKRKAIDFVSPGSLPHVPNIDTAACLRMRGKECTKCRDACPVAGTVVYDDTQRIIERRVGAIIVATGASLLDCSALPHLGYRQFPDVVTSLEFERMLASDGPHKGKLRTADRKAPLRIAIVHCVGSLDPEHKPYCSSICCQYALKYRAMIRDRLSDSFVIHFIREWCLPGQAAEMLFSKARNDRRTMFVRYDDISSLTVTRTGSRKRVSLKDEADHVMRWMVDMIVLCPAVIPSDDAAVFAERLGIPSDEHGFLRTALPSIDNTESPVRGIFIAGACHAPMDIRSSANEGRAAAGRLLAELKSEGRIEISPITAVVQTVGCSGCMLCMTLCPFRAITVDPSTGRASVVDELCDGCGICIAACPSGAIAGRHFSTGALVAEIAGVLDDSQE